MANLQHDFKYQCIDSLGRTRRGKVAAADLDQAIEKLRQRDYHIVTLEDRVSRLRAKVPALGRLALIFQQLSITLQTGIPISEAIEYLALDQAGNSRLFLLKIVRSLEQGATLTDSLPPIGGKWHQVVMAIIRAGEISGNLPESLQVLGEAMQRSIQGRRRLFEIFSYPILLLLTLVGAVWVLSGYALPRYIEAFQVSGTVVPGALIALLWLGRILGFLAPIVLFILVSIILSLFAQHKQGKTGLYDFFLTLLGKTPWLGTLLQEQELSKVAFFLSIMQRSGIDLTVALNCVAQITILPPLRSVLQQGELKISQGEALTNALRGDYPLPQLFLRTVGIGELSGTLPEQLAGISRYYAAQVEQRSQIFLALLQPGLILLVGGIVAAFAFAVFMPMLQLLGSF